MLPEWSSLIKYLGKRAFCPPFSETQGTHQSCVHWESLGEGGACKPRFLFFMEDPNDLRDILMTLQAGLHPERVSLGGISCLQAGSQGDPFTRIPTKSQAE